MRMAYFPKRAYDALFSKTHMLQVRCAHPTGNFAPKRPFGTFRCCGRLIFRFRTDPPSVRRCSARLIRQAETLELQPRSRPPSGHTMAFSTKRSTFRFAARTLRATSHRNAPSVRSGVPSGLFGFAETLGLQPLRGLRRGSRRDGVAETEGLPHGSAGFPPLPFTGAAGPARVRWPCGILRRFSSAR